jgi:hypothetical protein
MFVVDLVLPTMKIKVFIPSDVAQIVIEYLTMINHVVEWRRDGAWRSSTLSSS